MGYLTILIESIYYAVPVFVANMAPVIFQFIPFLNQPIDAGRSYKGARVLGKGKTWRGLILGTLSAIAIVYIQRALFSYDLFHQISLVDYSSVNWVLLGFLLGFGALLGDIVKSFFKRRLKVKSGQPWVPFDQIDFIIGAGLFCSFVYFSFSHYSYASLFY